MRRPIVLLLPFLLFLFSGCAPDSDDAAHYYRDAQTRFQQGQYDAAVVLLKNALQQAPDNPAYWQLLAETEERRGNLAEAFYCLTKALEFDPDNPQLLLRAGQYYVSGGNLKEALAIRQKLQQAAANDHDTRLFTALVDLKLGAYDEARRSAAEVRQRQPDDDQAVFIEAAALIALKKHDQAEELLRKAVQRFPANLALATLRFENLQRAGHIDAALAEIDRIQAATGQADLLLAKADLLEHNTRRKEAEHVYRQLIEAHPENARYPLQLARFLYRTGQPERAYAVLQDRLDRSAPTDELLRLYAHVAIATGKAVEARQWLQQFVARAGNEPVADTARLVLAGLWLESHDIDKAGELVSDILARDPDAYEALILQGEIQRRRQHIDAAIATLRKAINLRPNQARAWLALGAVHEAGGQNLLAQDAFEAAYNLARQQPAIAFAVASFHLRHGNAERAEAILDRLGKLDALPVRYALLKAAVKLRRHNWQEAEALLKAIERRQPGQITEVELLKGELFRQQQRWEKSIATYQRLVSNFPGEQRPLAALIRSYVDAGRFDEAEEFLRSVIAVYPDNTYARLLLAQRLIQKPDHAGAEKLLRETLTRAPQEPMTYIMLSRLLRQTGRAEDAGKVLDRWDRTRRWDAGIVFEQARLAETRGAREQAIELYRRILEHQGTNALAANNLASLLVEGQPSPEQLAEALRVSRPLGKSLNPYFLDTHGWVRYRAGKTEAARIAIGRAIRLLPDEPVFRLHLTRIHMDMEQPAQARAELDQALRLARERGDESLQAKARILLSTLEKTLDQTAAGSP